MRFASIIFFLGIQFTLQAQLSNNTFRHGQDLPKSKFGLSVKNLQYTKNNEYYNGINPGATFFGFQSQAAFHYRLNQNVTFSTGLLLQRDFGDQKGLSKAIPLFNFQMLHKNWKWNLGNVEPHIHHNLVEPLMDYENIIKQPVEGGFQGIRKTKNMFYDFWLEWRQLANGEKGLQEKIVFGHSLEFALLNTSTLNVSIPVQAIIYHQGGQALNINAHVATRVQAAGGLRLRNSDTTFLLEGFVFQSLDNSETESQPYKNGWASMLNLRVRPWKSHEVALSYWQSREFISNTGNPVFSNVNFNDPYYNANTRQLLMLRYVFTRPIVQNRLWVDFRLEPYYDMQYQSLEFSQGLYFRWVETVNFKIPRWLGM